ncbi:MAG: hypothetical protein ACR2LK_08670 [Solirubrobacteraceae bacterium]
MPAEDHFAASFRHAEDSTRLLAAGRPDNAAYLAGYVFESGLKLLIEQSAHHPGQALRIHDLRSLETLALVATLTEVDAEHGFPQAAISTARSSGWDVAWRYAADGEVSLSAVHSLVAAAAAMRHALAVAVLEGRVRP